MASFNPDLYRECLKLLVAARLKAGLTQQQLADRVGQRQTFVSKVELSERRLDPAEFVQISRAIGVDPYKLMRDAEVERSADSSERE